MGKKSILIISYSPLERDPRVLRQIENLGNNYNIYTAGLSASNHPHEKHFTKIEFYFDNLKYRDKPVLIRKTITLFLAIPFIILDRVWSYLFLRKLNFYRLYYWHVYRIFNLIKLVNIKADLILANDIEALPLAYRLSRIKKAKLVFDAHEYSPLEYEGDNKWLKNQSPYYTYLCKYYIPLTDYCVTVSQGLADKYYELTGVRFGLVYNAPDFIDIEPRNPLPDKIRFVHHGGASPIRKIENMILAFKELPEKYELHLVLVKDDPAYFESLLSVKGASKNIFFHEPVPTVEIPFFISQFDVALIFIPPVNFNYVYCLPNKFFESIQGRLMIISGTSIEMVRLINEHNLGIVAEGFDVDHIRQSVLAVKRENLMKYKTNAHKAASVLSSHNSMNLLKQKIDELCAA